MQGYYEKAFEYYAKDIIIQQKKIKYQNDRIFATSRLAELYLTSGDTITAIKYFNQSAIYSRPYDESKYYNLRGTVNFLQGNLDSALYYFKFVNASEDNPNLGEIYLLKKNYARALQYFLKPLVAAKKANKIYYNMVLLDNIAKCYANQNNLTLAQKYATELLATANATHSRQYIRDGNWLQWKIYDEKKNTDSAYKYRLQYDIMNDSIVQDELTRNLAVTQMKFNDEQKQSQIDLLKKDNQISQQQLKNESLQKNLLISGILVITILGSVILRTIVLKRKNEKLENEQKQSALQNKTVELEMQALRSQMNPHFIFNSLNSINRFILQNERKQASAYITKFSKLIRLILQNSQSALIPLDSELESLNLYLDLEALRFNYHFDYKISVPENLDVSALQVPPLILQPYTENAIWHGLMHKEEKGHLDIEVSEENNQLLFKITDDGIGRKQAAMFASKSATKHKSMGLQITESRIAIMQRDETAKTSITIHDLVNADGSGAGTEVVIKLPVIYD